MIITWDEPKRLINIQRHALDFRDLDDLFFVRANIGTAKKGRLRAIGRLADGTVVVIFATLGTEAISVISMRPANRQERILVNG